MLSWLANNWYILVFIIALIVIAIYYIYNFVALPHEDQIAEIKEWLKYAVAKVEKELGSETGQLKLLKVYDMFIERFSWISDFISFETFSNWVDEALAWLNNQIETNEKIAEYIGEDTEEDNEEDDNKEEDNEEDKDDNPEQDNEEDKDIEENK